MNKLHAILAEPNGLNAYAHVGKLSDAELAELAELEHASDAPTRRSVIHAVWREQNARAMEAHLAAEKKRLAARDKAEAKIAAKFAKK